MKKRPKKFALGDTVMVRRHVGSPWEPATYEKRFTDWRGWHRVALHAERRIDVMTGYEVADDTDAHITHNLCVPTQRVRAVRPYELDAS